MGKPQRIFISIPMCGKSNEKILLALDRISRELMNLYGEDTEIVDGWDSNRDKRDPLDLMGAALQEMSKCDTVYMARGWSSARGCKLEYMAAREYGKTIIYEDKGAI